MCVFETFILSEGIPTMEAFMAIAESETLALRPVKLLQVGVFAQLQEAERESELCLPGKGPP